MSRHDVLVNDLQHELVTAFHWRSDPPAWPESRAYFADDSGWFASAIILAQLGQPWAHCTTLDQRL